MRILRMMAIPLVLAALVVVGMLMTPQRRTEKKVVWETGGASGKADPVAATVNGEALRESDLVWTPPKGAFDIDQSEARQTRLDRMIQTLILRQFLRKEKVEVPESEVDREIADLRKNPPAAAGCSCCQYASLDQFMEANYLDLKELRALIAADLGFRRSLEAQWLKDCTPGEARDRRIREERSRIEQTYVKVSHIFFKTFQNPAFQSNPDAVRPEIAARAQAAWKDLQDGKSFDDAVRAVSEDAISRKKGGSLGCISQTAYGREFSEVVAGLKPGEYSKPVESPWGFHIVRRDAMQDNDVLDLVKSEWLDVRQSDLLNSIRMNANVVR